MKQSRIIIVTWNCPTELVGVHFSPLFNEFSFGSHEFISLLGTFIEEARVDLSLLILHGDVAGEDISVAYCLGHVRVTAAVVHHEALHQGAVKVCFVLHDTNKQVHNSGHCQISVKITEKYLR